MSYRCFIYLALFTFSSCVSTKKLYQGLTSESSTLEYLYDSKEFSSQKRDTIKVLNPRISDESFTNSGSLKKTKTTVLPLIIYTGWGNEHEYSIGENVILENVSDFIKTTTIVEANRSSMFFADSVGNSDLTLEIVIDSIGARGPYMSSGHVLFLLLAYSYSVSESVGAGIAYSKLRYQLKKNGDIILEGQSSKEIATEPFVNNFKNTKELRKYFSANLTEALALTIKENTEEIIKNLDKHYERR